MGKHRSPRRRLFRKPAPLPAVETPVEQDDYSELDDELDEYFEDDEMPTSAADQPIVTAPITAPVARVVDLAERRPRQTTGAEIVMMSRAATDAAVQAVYPDGRIEQVPCELRVVATLPAILDGMILNVTGGGRSAAIAVTHSP